MKLCKRILYCSMYLFYLNAGTWGASSDLHLRAEKGGRAVYKAVVSAAVLLVKHSNYASFSVNRKNFSSASPAPLAALDLLLDEIPAVAEESEI